MAPRRFTKKSKGEKTRERLIDKAIAILSRDGMAALTFEAVAKKADLRVPSLFYYFATKEALVHAAVDAVIQRLRSRTDESLSKKDMPSERLLKYFDTTVDWAEQLKDERQIVILLYYLASHEP